MKKINPIAEQSKEWLIKALFELMKEKPFSNIKITEISDKAQLSRRTFYRNFNTKEDLINEYTNHLFSEYLNKLNEIECLTYNRILITYFTFWDKHISELKLLKKNHLFYLLLEIQTSFISPLNSINAPWHNYSTSSEEQYIGLFNIGGLWNILSLWIDKDKREPPEEMAEIVKKNIINFSHNI